MALDTTSKGKFATNTVREANILIENLASRNRNHCPDYDRSQTVTVHSVDTDTVKELQEQVAYLMKTTTREQVVNGDAEVENEVVLYDGTKDISYIQGNYQNRGFNQNYRNYPNLFYRSTNVENP